MWFCPSVISKTIFGHKIQILILEWRKLRIFKSDPKRILKKAEEIHKYLSLRIKKFAHTWFSTKSSPSAGGGIFFCQKMHLESFRIFFWEWWFMRAQLSCNFSKIKMDWSWHYQMNNEAILVKQKNYQTCDEKQQCQEVKKSENEKKTSTKPTPTNITHPTDQGKKKRKNHRVSVYCLSFEKTWFFCIILESQNSHYFQYQTQVNLWTKCMTLPQCEM